jgi:hypothetical protein
MQGQDRPVCVLAIAVEVKLSKQEKWEKKQSIE